MTSRLKVMIGVLIVTSSYLFYDMSQGSSSKKPVKTEPATQVESPPVQTIAKRPGGLSRPRQSRTIPVNAGISISASWGRNPFKRGEVEIATSPVTLVKEIFTPESREQPAITSVPAFSESPDLSVSAITMGDQGARALINGRVRKVGDVVEGMMIINITGETVTLKGGGRTLILEVGS